MSPPLRGKPGRRLLRKLSPVPPGTESGFPPESDRAGDGGYSRRQGRVPPPPIPTLIWKQKTGIDVECQIYDTDLFDFDEEVKPLIHVLISKTLEDARREVLEEEELKEIIKEQEKYKTLFEQNNNRIKQREEDEINRFEEHKKKSAVSLNN